MPSPTFIPKSKSGEGFDGEPVSATPQKPAQPHLLEQSVNVAVPLPGYDLALLGQQYNHDASHHPTSAIPHRPVACRDKYLIPMLAPNERLRLTMFWYYTRGVHENAELLRRIQDKVNLLKEFVGWDIGLCGLLDSNVFERFVASGIPLGFVPRYESTCSHTCVQKPGTVLSMADMANDWRFKHSPPVEQGGLRSYAGTPLSCDVGNGEEIAMGSLCVASTTPGLELSPAQRDILVRFGDMVTTDIVHQCRWTRRMTQQRMDLLLKTALHDPTRVEERIFEILKEIYPQQEAAVLVAVDQKVKLSNGQTIVLSEAHHGVWEDHVVLDSLILSQHECITDVDKFVRAAFVTLVTKPLPQYLVLASRDIRLVFDDVDISFLEKCALILGSVAQNASLNEALRAKEEFMRGVTHQLRTPIHGMLGSVDLLTEELATKRLISESLQALSPKTLPIDEILATLRNSSMELMSTINNILTLHRWQEPGADSNASVSTTFDDLEHEMIENVLSYPSDDNFSKVRVLFDNQLPPRISGIVINIDLLKECLQSIVLNALQSTASGDVVITISTSEGESILFFDVEDTGSGIDADDHERVFEAYEKLDHYSRGVGLGLTLARKMAASLNGSLDLIASAKGKGSHFRATFRDPEFTSRNPVESSAHQKRAFEAEVFSLMNPRPDSLFHRRLIEHLQRSGFREGSKSEAAFSVLDHTSDPDLFRAALVREKPETVAICCVPSCEPREALQSSFPDVIFATGPFTTQSLHRLLTSALQTSQRRRPILDKVRLSLSSPNTTGSLTTRPSKRTSSTTDVNATAQERPHCLLVDDNDVNLRLLRMYCEKRKLAFSLAMDGYEAFREYQTFASSKTNRLVLLDLQMPRRNGVQACTDIRSFERAAGLKPAVIFIVTGQDSVQDKEQSIAAGADEFFVKPLSFKALDRNIAAYFREVP